MNYSILLVDGKEFKQGPGTTLGDLQKKTQYRGCTIRNNDIEYHTPEYVLELNKVYNLVRPDSESSDILGTKRKFYQQLEVSMTSEGLYNYFIGLQNAEHKGRINTDVKLLGEDDLNLPFVGRKEAIEDVSALFKEANQNSAAGNFDRNAYPIPICAWIPGMGKTALLHHGKEFLNKAEVKGHQISILVPYFNGCSLKWIDQHLPINVSFSWRLLYMFFLRGRGVGFPDFCELKMLPANYEELTFSVAIQTIRFAVYKAMENTDTPLGKEDVLSVFLGIDEFQKIADNETYHDHTICNIRGSVNNQNIVYKLKELCNTLHEHRYKEDLHVYPMFAGTDWELIRTSSTSSGLSVKRIKMPPLTPVQVECMVQPLLSDMIFTSSLMAKHLFVLGSLPRTALAYSKRMAKISDPSADQMNEVYGEVCREFALIWQDSPSLLAKLLAYSFTMVDVTNDVMVSYSVKGCNQSTSIRKMSDSGICLISSVPNLLGEYVSVPYMAVHQFANCQASCFATSEEKCLHACVKWLVDNIDFQLYSKQRWLLSEDFGCVYMACRINSFLILGQNTILISNLWAGAMCNLKSDMEIILKPVTVVRARDAINRDTKVDIYEMGTSHIVKWVGNSTTISYVMRNANNATAVDNFFGMMNTDNVPVLFLEQTKTVATYGASSTVVNDLYEKIEGVCPKTEFFKNCIVIYCFRNQFQRVGNILPEQLPLNSIVVLRNHLDAFYGMFARHPAVSPYVDVNDCSKAQLFSMGLRMNDDKSTTSSSEAVNLVWERAQTKNFQSYADFYNFLADKGIYIEKDSFTWSNNA